jgi:hypothetical protein
MPEAAVHEYCKLRTREGDIDTNGPSLIDLDAVILAKPRPGAMER